MSEPALPPARELESALAAARVEIQRLRAALQHIADNFGPLSGEYARAALSPPAAPGPATGGTT